MMAMLLAMLVSANEGRYPAWKNSCWLSSPMLTSMDEVTDYMDNNLSDWSAERSSVIPTYSNGVKWYVVYPELSMMPKCLAKAKKK